MSKLILGKLLAVSMLALGMAILSGACLAPAYKYGVCSEDADCRTEVNYRGYSSVCLSGFCRCPQPDEVACCPDGAESCAPDFYDCRSRAECGLCESDAECPGPPDSRCGAGLCREGKCSLEIVGGLPISSQRRGDCKAVYCTFEGTTIDVQDPSDVLLDGNLCTIDICNGLEPMNLPLANGAPFLGKDFGICVEGKYQDCSKPLNVLLCPEGRECDGNNCLPSPCFDQLMNGQETYTDCGGPDCAPCFVGAPCIQGKDCTSGVCIAGECQESKHDDGVQNDGETGVDCGYPGAPPFSCPDGQGCNSPDDCQSSVCFDGLCLSPNCFDAVKNGQETGVDCGGNCDPCPQ